MNLCWVTIHVQDIEASLSFYHGLLGLPIASRHSGHGMDMVMLGDKDQPKVELLYLEGQPKANAGTALSIGFQVKSLNEAMELMKANHIPITRGPVSPNPFTSFFFVQDPDQVTVQFVESKSRES